MSMEEQQVVMVIQDASKKICVSAIRWALDGLALKAGDSLTLLGVLHQVNNPMGYKTRVDSSVFGSNKKVIAEELARRIKEYQADEEVIKMAELYEIRKVEFNIEIRSGTSPTIVALKAVEIRRPTWAILDREMKKDRRFFLQNFSCGILRMKQFNRIEKLRGPKIDYMNDLHSDRSSISIVTYDNMTLGLPEDDNPFSIDFTAADQTNDNASAQIEKDSMEDKQPEIILDELGINSTLANEDGQGSGSGQTQTASDEDLSDFLMPELEAFDDSSCTICKNRRPPDGWKRDFTHKELRAATDDFSQEYIISDGEFGTVYKGKLKNGLRIAIKQNKSVSVQEENQFMAEIHILSKARHRNVVKLLGSCLEGNLRLPVYEYVCNGSLDLQLKTLSWEERMKIALGASRGLNYLHENNIIHRDVRPENILVTHDHEALLGGFQLAKETHELDQSVQSTVIGTFGYLAPEYAENGKVSTKTDVYAFGVVLLQLITGRCTTDARLGERSLVGWARPLIKEKKFSELVDPSILNCHDPKQLYWMVRLAEACLSMDPHKRSPMSKVVFTFEYVMEGKTAFGVEKVELSKHENVSTKAQSKNSMEKTNRSISSPLSVAIPYTSRSMAFANSEATSDSGKRNHQLIRPNSWINNNYMLRRPSIIIEQQRER